MSRKGKKPTVAQLEERIERLELAMGEAQQYLNLIGASARNDIMRHEDMIQELCEKTDVEFKPHPIPEEKVEESQGGLTDMANVLLLCDKLPLVWEWLEANPGCRSLVLRKRTT